MQTTTQTTYSAATIKRCATILGNTSMENILAVIAADNSKAPTTKRTKAPAKTAKPTKAPAKTPQSRDWRDERPTKGQIKRNRACLAEINRLERFLGYAPSTHQSLNGGVRAPLTGQGYRDHYQRNLKPNLASLKAEARALSHRA